MATVDALIWLQSAQDERDFAVDALANSQSPNKYRYIARNCFQTVENAVKAVFLAVKPTDKLPHKHDVQQILCMLENFVSDEDRAKLYYIASIVAPYGPSFKYPPFLDPNKDDCLDLLKQTDLFLQWASNVVTDTAIITRGSRPQ